MAEELTDIVNSPSAAGQQLVEYTDDNIRHLSDMEHVRTVRVCISAALATDRCPKTVFMSC